MFFCQQIFFFSLGFDVVCRAGCRVPTTDYRYWNGIVFLLRFWMLRWRNCTKVQLVICYCVGLRKGDFVENCIFNLAEEQRNEIQTISNKIMMIIAWNSITYTRDTIQHLKYTRHVTSYNIQIHQVRFATFQHCKRDWKFFIFRRRNLEWPLILVVIW